MWSHMQFDKTRYTQEAGEGLEAFTQTPPSSCLEVGRDHVWSVLLSSGNWGKTSLPTTRNVNTWPSIGVLCGFFLPRLSGDMIVPGFSLAPCLLHWSFLPFFLQLQSGLLNYSVLWEPRWIAWSKIVKCVIISLITLSYFLRHCALLVVMLVFERVSLSKLTTKRAHTKKQISCMLGFRVIWPSIVLMATWQLNVYMTVFVCRLSLCSSHPWILGMKVWQRIRVRGYLFLLTPPTIFISLLCFPSIHPLPPPSFPPPPFSPPSFLQ